MITKRIEGAQKAVESQNFESRKHLLEYDDVMNKQREAVYGLRRSLLMAVEQRELILDDYLSNILSAILDEFAPETAHPEQWNLKGLKDRLIAQFGLDLDREGINPMEITRHELGEAAYDKLRADYESKEKILGAEAMRYHERMVMLSVLDGLWKDHLLEMDHLKEGIGMRGYAQQDPLVAYKKESFEMFEAMMTRFQEDTARYLFRMQIVGPDGQPFTEAPKLERTVPAAPPVDSAALAPPPSLGSGQPSGPAREIPVPTRAPTTTIDALEKEFERKKQRELGAARMAGAAGSSEPAQRHTGAKVGRNDPCPCGSGKKYKKCHGAEA
jgi:preprotein translocase subunit SecA